MRAVRLVAGGALLLSACSTDNPMSLRPDVDVGTTASFAPRDAAIAEPSGAAEYVLPTQDDLTGSDNADAFGRASSSGYDPLLGSAEVPSDETDAAQSSVQSDALVEADPAANEMSDGQEQPPGEAAVASNEMAGEQGEIQPLSTLVDMDGAAQPGVSEYRVDNVDEVNIGGAQQATETAGSYEVAALPRTDESFVDVEPTMPASEVDCRAGLDRLDVAYKDLDPIREGASCGIDHPVRVSAIGRVKMVPAATLTCDMALAFATWTKKELVPAAKRRYLTGVKAIHQASSYACRNVRRSGGVLSEHGRGNALDVARIELNSGRDIDVRKPGWFSFRTKGFLNSVRADGCEYFNTVLGPGYDRDHKDHFHFDIKQRQGGYRACR